MVGGSALDVMAALCAFAAGSSSSSSSSRPCVLEAVSDDQLASLAQLPRREKLALYEYVSTDAPENYHRVSCRPITRAAEDDMELLSDIVS